MDVGFAHTGWVVFDKGQPVGCGCISTKKNELEFSKTKYRVALDYVTRATKLSYSMYKVILAHQCTAVIGELPTGGSQSAEAAKQMSMSTAIASTVVKLARLPSKWSTPAQGKIALVGKRTADKNQMMAAARSLYPDFPWPKAKVRFEHIADAVASYVALQHTDIVKKHG